MAPRKFDNTTWGVWHPERLSTDGWNKPGWEMPSDHSRYIGSSDQGYWDRVLGDARTTYGDPHIHYNTDDPNQARRLVFGDGTPLPADGTVVYHDARTKRNWIQHDDGSVQLAGPDGRPLPGVPQAPAAYRRTPDGQVAPIDARGQQIAPLRADVPTDKGQSYYDRNGVLTPTNPKGDYYTLDGDGTKKYFDKDGRPISKEQFEGTPAAGTDTGASKGDTAQLSTDEETSGRAADAIKKVKDALSARSSKAHDADAKLAELMLSAHGASDEGRTALEGMQKDIEAALNDPNSSLDTDAGELQFLKLLRDKASAASDLLKSGKIADADRAKMALALADFYRDGDSAAGTPQPGPGSPSPVPVDPGLTPGEPPPSLLPWAPLGPPPQMPDPGLGITDPSSGLAGMLPGLLSGLGGPLSGLGGGPDLGAITKPIGDAIAAAGDHRNNDVGHGERGDKDNDGTGKKGDPGQQPQPGQPQPGAQPPAAPPAGQPPAAAPAAAPGTMPGGPPGAPPGPVALTLKDGSPVTVADSDHAGAIKAVEQGATPGDAYRRNNLTVPPPGTTLTNYIAPDKLQPTDYAMYRDKMVMMAGPDKFFGENGEVQPISQLPHGDFLGYGRPTASAQMPTTPGAAPTAPAAPGPAPTPAPGTPPPTQSH